MVMSLGQGGHGEKVDEDRDYLLYRFPNQVHVYQ